MPPDPLSPVPLDAATRRFATTSLEGPPYVRVVRHFEEQIRRGQFAQGQKLPTESDMGDYFGVSRRSVREAIKVLATMGLVEARHGSGIYVRNNPVASISHALTLSVLPERESVLGLLEFREVLETRAAAFAALRRSEAQVAIIRDWADAAVAAAHNGDRELFITANQHFHTAVGEASGNPYLAVLISVVRLMQHEAAQRAPRQHGSLKTAAQAHMRLVEAIAAGLPDEATAAVRADIQTAIEAFSGGVAS